MVFHGIMSHFSLHLIVLISWDEEIEHSSYFSIMPYLENINPQSWYLMSACNLKILFSFPEIETKISSLDEEIFLPVRHMFHLLLSKLLVIVI